MVIADTAAIPFHFTLSKGKMIAVIIAIYGTIISNPKYLVTFLSYFVPSILIISAMLARKDIMVFVAKLLRSVQGKYRKHTVLSERSLYHSIKELTKQQFVFFSKGHIIYL